ncbi:putative inorganic phosphate cotransporter isoform X1 [Trichogramma pretiosum]|uniref:putative inorganic phosphate cotransporter isoform X1 n=2 Tax=Trichogramma pretiosum TaxID=7493 RepID=UPI0006C99D63|nr:putative inorganic phosphate cotransporter isoform X1 [Trichogramma pretiosum]XP_014220845.1 putative inorganic phosphate cotransporter isoform X1 [Trichogramma pretiosum]
MTQYKSERTPLLTCSWRSTTNFRWYRSRQRGSYVPQRWVFAIMGFLALLNAYAMRVCLSIAITQMTIEHHSNTTSNDSSLDRCPDLSQAKNITVSAPTGPLYDWDETSQGIILSSFYWGYIVTHLPGGMLAERFGGKYCLGLGILSTAVFTLLTPLATEWGGMKALVVLRILMGLGEGTTFPAVNVMLAQWTPPQERSKIGSLVFAGAQLGTVVSTLLSGEILKSSEIGWPLVFYVFGGFGVVWFIFFQLLCYNNPREHPYISEKEAKFLHDRMNEHTSQRAPGPVPWRAILTSAPLWALLVAQIGHDWGFYTMVTDLPKYMHSVMRFRIEENGWWSSLPYLCMWICSCVTSWLADWAIVNKYMSTTNVRKLGTTIASIGPGIFIIGASYAGCDQMSVVVLFTIGMTLMGTFYPGMKVNALDLSPNFSGTLMAIVNGVASITGMVTPYIVGVMTPNSTVAEWRMVFWIVFIVFLVTNLVFVLFASGEIQPWNNPDYRNNVESQKKEEEEKKKAEQLKNAT